jgi:hypothetical protein
MKITVPKPLRCAIYTRKSTEHNLDLAFNSLDAQREACEAYVKSQAHEGWRLLPNRYEMAGFPAPRWSVPLCNSCSKRSGRAGWRWSSSTRSTV